MLASARFFDRALEDHPTSRVVFFRDLWHTVTEPSLLFFDPDIGLAPTAREGRRSAMYLFRDELAEGYDRGHSLIVYQHFPREQRPVYLARTFADLRAACGAPGIFALWSSRVAFLVIPQEGVTAPLAGVAHELGSRWTPLLAYTAAEKAAPAVGCANSITR